jgi:hypothetical protein
MTSSSLVSFLFDLSICAKTFKVAQHFEKVGNVLVMGLFVGDQVEQEA